MKKKYGFIGAAAALAVTLAFSAPASATNIDGPLFQAHIGIDDSNASTITISASGFAGGFFVNDAQLADGGSITLADGALYTINGSWDAMGFPGGGYSGLLFALPGDPMNITSGIGFEWFGGAPPDLAAFFSNINGLGQGFASLNGYFGGFGPPASYPNISMLPTLLQDGQTGLTDLPFLMVDFISETPNPNPVPEPATMLLLGTGIAGLAGCSRLRRKK